MQKKIVTVLKVVLCITFLICICGFIACGESQPKESTYGDYTLTPNSSFKFTLNEDNQSFTLEEFVGNETEIVVPETYFDLPITDIGTRAFSGNANITSVILPDTILRVEKGAFAGCSNLQYNEYNGGKYLGNKDNNYLVFVQVGESGVSYLHNDMQVIKDGALLKDAEFNTKRYGNGVYLSSEKNAYFALIKMDDKSKNSITIHNNTKFVLLVEEDFGNLESVNVLDVETWCKLVFVNQTEGNYGYAPFARNLNLLHNNVSLYADGKVVVDLAVPEGTTRINDYAFSGYSKLKSITLPDGLEYVGKYAFDSCTELRSFSIPDSVKGCGVNAFYGCSPYAEYNELDGNKYLGNDTNKYLLLIEANGDTNVTVKENTNYIDFNNFSPSVKSVTLEQNNKYYSIVDGVLYNKDQTKIYFISQDFEGTITVPKNACEIDLLFANNYAKIQAINVSAENANYSSQDGIIYNKAQTQILKIPQTFSGTVTLPVGISVIPKALKKSSVTLNIPDNSLYFAKQDNVIYNKDMTEIVYVPQNISGTVNLPSGVSEIPNELRKSSVTLKIPDNSLYFAMQDMVVYNKAMTEIVYIPQGLSGDVTLPKGVSVIPEEFKASNVTLKIPADSSYFAEKDKIIYNKQLTNVVHIPLNLSGTVTLPKELTSIDCQLLKQCNNLERINVESGNAVYSSQNGILYNQNNTELLVVPNNLSGAVSIASGTQKIASKAFASCTKITSVYIPQTVTQISGGTFSSCALLTTFYVQAPSKPEGWSASWSLVSAQRDNVTVTWNYTI